MSNLDKLYSSIKISPLHRGRKWIVLDDLEYIFTSFWKPIIIHIPKGFEFDGASTPRVFHIIGTPMWTDTIIGALFHDYLYRTQTLTRNQSDQCFNELMLLTKTRFIKRGLFYLWVRLWGWIAWQQNEAKKKLEKHYN